MNKKVMAYLASGLMLFGAVTGLGVYKARAAETGTPVTQTDIQQQEQKDEQNKAYTSSIRTNDLKDADEVKGQDNEAAESSSLQPLAKINAEDAKVAALKAVPGTATKVSLENENGNVVYGVEVQTAKGITDVKIDAGNGQVLAQDSEQENEVGQDNGEEEGVNGSDNDNVQSEQ
ncbi:MAG: PepSY domain-containing protein [Desulfocucumaceae bacterium]